MNKQGQIKIYCTHCGKKFSTKHRTSRFCSKKCYKLNSNEFDKILDYRHLYFKHYYENVIKKNAEKMEKRRKNAREYKKKDKLARPIIHDGIYAKR